MSAKSESDADAEACEIGGVRISHPNRAVYENGLTKADVARHFETVAARFLEHAADRPVSLLRCPGGMAEECFFQKHAGKGFPDGIGTVEIREKDGETAPYMYLSSARGMLGAVQMGTLEFHPWASARDRLERPDRMIFDLDPDEGLNFSRVKAAAREVREALEKIGLPGAAMVTGGKGVHVIVPLRRIADFDTVKTFARTFATVLAERHPDRYTATMSKARRKGKVFIDWLRNERGATAIAPYSLRARKGAPVAVPVTWEELDALDRPNGFGVADMKARLSRPCPLAGTPRKGIGREAVAALEDWSGNG